MKLKNTFLLVLISVYLFACAKEDCRNQEEPSFELYIAKMSNSTNNATVSNISLKNAIKQPNLTDGIVGLDMNRDTTTLQITLSDNSVHNVTFAYTRNVYYKSKQCGFVMELDKNNNIKFVREKSSPMIDDANVKFQGYTPTNFINAILLYPFLLGSQRNDVSTMTVYFK